MQVIKLEEAGYEQALKGIALSFYDHAIPFEVFWTSERRERTIHRSEQLAFKGGGHNKFLASIFTWWMVQASRAWWQEYDTYKVATFSEGNDPFIVCLGLPVVGSSSNSASTMHTLDKRIAVRGDFEEGTSYESVNAYNNCLDQYKDPESHKYKDITSLKQNLPEGWLQERTVCLNYMSLQNIINQRGLHRLKHWRIFVESIIDQVEHPELLKQGVKL